MKDQDYSMKSRFEDESDIDYDHAINNARNKMSGMTNPCDASFTLFTLMHTLQITHNTYYSRPCNSGWCMSLFTPHRDRIRERMNALSREGTVYTADCRELKTTVHQIQLENNRLEAARKIAEAKLEFEKKQAEKNREFTAEQEAEKRKFQERQTKSEREFIAAQDDKNREFTAQQNDLDRKHKEDLAGIEKMDNRFRFQI